MARHGGEIVIECSVSEMSLAECWYSRHYNQLLPNSLSQSCSFQCLPGHRSKRVKAGHVERVRDS